MYFRVKWFGISQVNWNSHLIHLGPFFREENTHQSQERVKDLDRVEGHDYTSSVWVLTID